jgi:hypothetical protein
MTTGLTIGLCLLAGVAVVAGGVVLMASKYRKF